MSETETATEALVEAALRAPRRASSGTNYKLPGRATMPQVLEVEDMLHGAHLTTSDREVQRERATHRMIIYLAAQSLSNVEIAERLGVCTNTVSRCLAQPWAKEQLVKELRDAGKDVVAEMLKAAATDSIATLLAVRDNPVEKGATRVAAANSLLDRFLGKPVARVELSKASPELDEVDKIDAELARLRACESNGALPTTAPANEVSPRYNLQEKPL